MNIKQILWTLFLISVAITIMVVGEVTRSYPAFGGEDILGIIITSYALIGYMEYRDEKRTNTGR